MKYEIRQINDPDLKSKITYDILTSLPEWFGIPESIKEYVEGVKPLPFWAAFIENECLGFFAGKIHYNRTGDIYVCAINKNYHNKGIGTALYKAMEKYFKKQKCTYVIVKTLSDIVDYKPYKATHKFYKSIGFKELLTLTEMWDKENPCLIMIKKIRKKFN